ncbi:MAG: hypothetical protein JWN04_1219 [Myxococcaceae bacterium]|nr:hypothetical protein [Myxococcaceae bacterium]
MPDTKQPELSMERFSALVEAYGADLERFPARERAAASALALRSTEAQQLLAAARVFDSLLASARDDLPSVELEEKLARIPERYQQQRPSVRLLPFRSHARAGLAAAAAVLLGLASGQLVNSEAGAGDDTPISGEQADVASITFADGLFSDLTVDAAHSATSQEGAAE